MMPAVFGASSRSPLVPHGAKSQPLLASKVSWRCRRSSNLSTMESVPVSGNLRNQPSQLQCIQTCSHWQCEWRAKSKEWRAVAVYINVSLLWRLRVDVLFVLRLQCSPHFEAPKAGLRPGRECIWKLVRSVSKDQRDVTMSIHISPNRPILIPVNLFAKNDDIENVCAPTVQ